MREKEAGKSNLVIFSWLLPLNPVQRYVGKGLEGCAVPDDREWGFQEVVGGEDKRNLHSKI